MWQNKISFSQDTQKDRPARPQAEQEPEAYPQGYVEDSCELRTPLTDFFSILLERPFGDLIQLIKIYRIQPTQTTQRRLDPVDFYKLDQIPEGAL